MNTGGCAGDRNITTGRVMHVSKYTRGWSCDREGPSGSESAGLMDFCTIESSEKAEKSNVMELKVWISCGFHIGELKLKKETLYVGLSNFIAVAFEDCFINVRKKSKNNQ